MKKSERIYIFICLVILFIGLVGLFSGCKSDKPFTGIIVDKEYIPIHRESRTRLIGKIIQSYRVTVPSAWKVFVANRDAVRCFEVDSMKYESYKIGERYTFEEILLNKNN